MALTAAMKTLALADSHSVEQYMDERQMAVKNLY